MSSDPISEKFCQNYLRLTISWDISQCSNTLYRIQKTNFRQGMRATKVCMTHNPPMSSNLTFWAFNSILTVGSFHSLIISSEHAWSMTPASFGASKSISVEPSKLALAVAMSLPKAPFHWVVELIASSLNFPVFFFTTGDRWVGSNSEDPAGVIFRRRDSSTCCSGRSRILNLRSSGLTITFEGRSIGWSSVNGCGGEEDDSVMVSRIKRTERTTFNWTTALQDARSLRNAYYQVWQSILESL